MAEFFKSQRGKPKLAYQGYCYTENGKSTAKEGERYWRCDQYTPSKCRGRAITDSSNQVTVTGAHEHLPDPLDVQVSVTHNTSADNLYLFT